jgi:DNA-binding response OmpR family regulator
MARRPTAGRRSRSTPPRSPTWSLGQKSVVIEAIQAGAKDFIVKPFQPERVLDSIKKLIG